MQVAWVAFAVALLCASGGALTIDDFPEDAAFVFKQGGEEDEVALRPEVFDAPPPQERVTHAGMHDVASRQLTSANCSAGGWCIIWEGSHPGTRTATIVSNLDRDLMVYLGEGYTWGITFVPLNGAVMHWNGLDRVAVMVIVPANSVLSVLNASSPTNGSYYEPRDQWTDYFSGGYVVSDETLTATGLTFLRRRILRPWGADFYVNATMTTTNLITYAVVVEFLTTLSGQDGVYQYDAHMLIYDTLEQPLTNRTDMGFSMKVFHQPLVYIGHAEYDPARPFDVILFKGPTIFATFPGASTAAFPECLYQGDLHLWPGQTVQVACKFRLGGPRLPGYVRFSLNQTVTKEAFAVSPDSVAWSASSCFPTVVSANYLNLNGYYQNFSLTATQIGLVNLSAVLSSPELGDFAAKSLAVARVEIHANSTVTMGDAGVVVLAAGVPQQVPIRLSAAPYLGKSLSGTITFSGISGLTITPSILTLSSTEQFVTMTATELGAFQLTITLTGSAVYQYTPLAQATGLSQIARTDVVFSTVPAYVAYGAPRAINVSVGHVPLPGTDLTVNFTQIGGTGRVTFSGSCSLTSTSPAPFCGVLVFSHGDGPVLVRASAWGSATDPPQYGLLTANATFLSYTKLVPVVGGLDNNVIQNVYTAFTITLYPPRQGTQLTITPSCDQCIINPPSASIACSASDPDTPAVAVFSVSVTQVGRFNLTLAFAGNGSDQYAAPNQEIISVAQADAITVQPLSPALIWVGTSRSVLITATPRPGTELVLCPYISSGTGDVSFEPASLTLTAEEPIAVVILTPLGIGPVVVAFAKSGNSSQDQYALTTPAPLNIAVTQRGTVDVVGLPASVTPRVPVRFNISISTPCVGQNLRVSPLASFIGGGSETLSPVDFLDGSSVLTQTVTYTPQTIGSLQFSLNVVDLFGEYLVSDPATTVVEFNPKATITTDLPSTIIGNTQTTMIITLSASPVQSITLRVTVTGGSAAPTNVVFGMSVNQSVTMVTFDMRGTQQVTLSLAEDSLQQYAAPAALVVIVVTPPDAPTVSAVAIDTTSIQISWQELVNGGGQDITSYGIVVSHSDSATLVANQITDANTTQLIVGQLTAGTSYNVAVVAVNAIGASPAGTALVQTLSEQGPSALINGGAGSGGSSSGRTAGAVVGVLLALVLIAVVCAYLWWRRKRMYRWDADGGIGTVRLDLAQKQGSKKHMERLLKRKDTLVIGRGGFAEVFRAKDGEEWVAIKQLVRHTPESLREFHQEVFILSKLGGRNHPNVIELKAFTDDPPCIVMELAESGSLHDILATLPTSPEMEKTVVKYMHQIASGLAFLHRCDVAHLDIKPRNLLIGGHGALKISDFGISQSCEKSYVATEFVGTPAYSAPERFDLNRTLELRAADVYSFGLTSWAMLTGTEPFVGLSPTAIVERNGEFNAWYNASPRMTPEPTLALFSFPQRVPPRLAALLESTLHIDPAVRATMVDTVLALRACEWADGVDFEIETSTVYTSIMPIGSTPSTSPLNSFQQPSDQPSDLMAENPVFASASTIVDDAGVGDTVVTTLGSMGGPAETTASPATMETTNQRDQPVLSNLASASSQVTSPMATILAGEMIMASTSALETTRGAEETAAAAPPPLPGRPELPPRRRLKSEVQGN